MVVSMAAAFEGIAGNSGPVNKMAKQCLLRARYAAAVQVEPVRASRLRQPSFMRLKGARGFRKPGDGELVYLERSPSYCEADVATGSVGTVGRLCDNGTSSSAREGDCGSMCCGHGHDAHLRTRVWQCHCKFQWCCLVTCNTCSEKTQVFTCM